MGGIDGRRVALDLTGQWLAVLVGHRVNRLTGGLDAGLAHVRSDAGVDVSHLLRAEHLLF